MFGQSSNDGWHSLLVKLCSFEGRRNTACEQAVPPANSVPTSNRVMDMMKILALMTVLMAASAATGDVVVARWGAAGKVQHPGTLAYEDAGKAGLAMRFDLSALSKRTKVHRARLVMSRRGGYGDSFEVFEGRVDGKAVVPAAKRPLAPVPPYCRWYDVTEAVRAGMKRSSAVFLVTGAPAVRRKATYLEIAHEGRLADPPEQVSGAKATYRGGQVFITFREIEDLSEGKQRYSWGDLIRKVRGYSADGLSPKDDRRELRYRVYRHDRPITAETIGDAELLAELVSGTGFNTRIVKRIWQGENRPSKLDDKFIAVRLCVEPGKPLPPGVGVYVHTVRRAGQAWYAVLTAVDGVENTSELSAKNVVGPVTQKVAEPEPVLQAETLTPGAYKRKADDLITRRYCYWAVAPAAPRPLQYGLVLQWYPNRIAKPAALEYSHGMAHPVEPNLARRQRTDAILLAGSSDPQNGLYLGSNNCHTTLKSFRQGTWQPWTYNRAAKWIAWVRENHAIDPQQIYCYGSHWGMWELRHPGLFSVFIGWGSGDLTRGFVDWNRANGTWGPPSAFAGKPDAENPYMMNDMVRYVSADPARKLPVQFLLSCTGSHTSEMSYMSLPMYKAALRDAKQPFAGSISRVSWGFGTPAALAEYRAGRLKILRDQSKPAFGNCSIDDNPGSGDYRAGDPKGLLNGHLLWETESIADKPRRWEMTVYLHKTAPVDACTVDLTPRHCQQFKVPAGRACEWTNSPAAGGEAAKRGTVTADKHGLVTIRSLKVTKARNRIVIVKK